MMSPTTEDRVSAVERAQDRLVQTLEQTSRAMIKIEQHVEELFESKSKLDSLDAAWKRIDELSRNYGRLDRDFSILQAEHIKCKPLVESMSHCTGIYDHRLRAIEDKMSTASNFVQGRAASVADKLIWVALTVIAFGSVVMSIKVFK